MVNVDIVSGPTFFDMVFSLADFDKTVKFKVNNGRASGDLTLFISGIWRGEMGIDGEKYWEFSCPIGLHGKVHGRYSPNTKRGVLVIPDSANEKISELFGKATGWY